MRSSPVPIVSSGDIPRHSSDPVQGNILFFAAKIRGDPKLPLSSPSLPFPPWDLHKAHPPLKGDFLQSTFCLQGTGYKHHRLITALIFPRNLFTPCMELNLVLQPSPTYICKAGNSLLPPTLSILVPPGQALALRIDDFGEMPTFICFFFPDSCLFKMKREALSVTPGNYKLGSTGTPDSALLSFLGPPVSPFPGSPGRSHSWIFAKVRSARGFPTPL